jgi:ubiquinone/menaquinone biosynthesis C-methylase UbiE
MTEQASERLVDQVRERYGRIAEAGSGCCGSHGPCGGSAEPAVSLGIGYSPEELAQIPAEANLGLGCGAPLAYLALQKGETVLDLGSGGGIDALLAARQVGPEGRVIGVDMTPAMLERARNNAARAGVSHVEFREGRLEALPVEDGSMCAVTSNCVINLVPDKGRVFAEIARVLRPGGRLVVSDIVLDGPLPESVASDVFAYVGCVSGAMQRQAYFGLLREAGLLEIEILRDVDYLASVAETEPRWLEELAARTKVDPADVQGRVRSVTYRARKPAAAERCCDSTCCS